jgi:hypothetical protein
MFLTDEIGGEIYAVGEVNFHKPVITVRELIGVRVDLECEAHRDRQAEARRRTMPGISSRELQLNGSMQAAMPRIPTSGTATPRNIGAKPTARLWSNPAKGGAPRWSASCRG